MKKIAILFVLFGVGLYINGCNNIDKNTQNKADIAKTTETETTTSEEAVSNEYTQVDREEISSEYTQVDREELLSDMKRYLDMTIEEISEETNVYLDEEDGTLRILSNVAFFPVLALEDKGIFVICHTYDTAYKPVYVTVHYDLQPILLEEFGITNDMDFEDIKEVMTMAGWQLDEHIEWGGDYADVYSNGELLYTFCSYREDGSHFQIYISSCPDEEEEPVKPMIENGRIDEEGIKWFDIYAEVGNISEEERDSFTYFFQKNKGYGFLKSDYDNPKDVDLGMVFWGGLKSEWDETTLENSELDYGYKDKAEVDETLLQFTGLTNDDMNSPLYVKAVDGKEVIAWLPFQKKPDTPVCLGGYKNGDIYTLLMLLPYSVVTLKKTDAGTVEILSNRTLRSVTISYEGKGYNSEKVYREKSLSEYILNDLEILRNEYYARHGMIFDDPVMTLYFESEGWYKPSVTDKEFDESVFNEVEKANLELIEEKMKELEEVGKN